jgi:hypothetical protein
MTGISGNYGYSLQQAMLSANSAMMQAKVRSSVKNQLDGRAGVLKAEMKQDGATGGTSKSKQEELERVQKASEEVAKDQAGALEKANQALEEAAKADKKEISSSKKAEKEDEAGSSKISEKKDGRETAGSRLYTSEGQLAGEEKKSALSLRA